MPEKDNDTKLRIYAVAIALFQEKGFDEVTIRDICAAAEVSKHTFYYYFASKDELLRCFHGLPKQFHEELLRDVLAAENFFEQFMLLTSHMTDFFLRMGPEISKRVIALDVNRKNDSLDHMRKPHVHDLEHGIIKKAQAAGEIRNQSAPDALVAISFGLLFNAVFHWSMHGGTYDLRVAARAMLEAAFDVRPDLRKAGGVAFWAHGHSTEDPASETQK